MAATLPVLLVLNNNIPFFIEYLLSLEHED